MRTWCVSILVKPAMMQGAYLVCFYISKAYHDHWWCVSMLVKTTMLNLYTFEAVVCLRVCAMGPGREA